MTNFKNIHVLVIEDQANYIEAIRAKLGETFSVGITKNGVSGLARMEEQSDLWDIILCDYMMPEMRGDEVISEIRKFNKNIPIIAISTEENYKLLNAGATVQENKATILLRTPEAKENWIKLIHELIAKYPKVK